MISWLCLKSGKRGLASVDCSFNSASASLRLAEGNILSEVETVPTGAFSHCKCAWSFKCFGKQIKEPFHWQAPCLWFLSFTMLEPGSTMLVVLLGSRTLWFSGGKGEGILDFSLHILQDQAEGPNTNMLANEPPSLCASIRKMALRAS